MRTIAKLRLRKVVAGSLAIILVILGVFGYGVPVLANDDSGAYSVRQNSAGEPLTLGNQSRDAESGEYFYPDAVVDKDAVRSLIIAFKSSVSEGSKIILPENTANITLGNGTDTYKIINVASDTTSEDVQNYIRSVRFSLDASDESADLMIIVSDDEITGTVYYDSSNRHFYQFVSGSVTWKEAREKALNMSIGGRPGYLATVTSSHEDDFLGTVGSNQLGWLGGTRLVRSGSTFAYSSQTISETAAGTKGMYPWYWADGPEKNTQFLDRAAMSKKSYSSYSGFFADFNFDMDVLDVYSNNIGGGYQNFYFNSNNYQSCEPVNSANFTSSCLIRYNQTGSDSTRSCSWIARAYNATGNVSGYYVEYGDKVTGDTHESGDPDTVIVRLKQMTNVAKPYLSIDYINEEIIGFDSSSSYKIKVGESGEERIFSDMTSLVISGDWFGESLYVKACGDGIYTADSAVTEVAVPERHSAPVGLQGYNRTIYNVTSEMEYRRAANASSGAEAGEWKKITGDKVQKLLVGDYEVRYSATSSYFKSEPTTVYVEYYGADVSITTSRKVDVALSVGITGTAYNQFKEDLTNAIIAKSPSFDLNNLNIMSATSVNTSGQSSFSWMQFDHSYSPSIYNNNTYIENTNSAATQSDNAYNSKDYHIVSESNGTKLTFYGYGSSGYSDFMLLENDQQTNKKFEFAIKEYYAADALYGTGFFFNCNMNKGNYSTNAAAYNNSALKMSGYLAVIEYNGSSATGFSVYQFENLNLRNFHNTSTNNVNDALTSYSTSVTKIGSANISSSHDLRKFVIDVSPKKVKIYYAGFDDETHAVTNITSESQAQSFNTSSNGYKAFSSMKFSKSETDVTDTKYIGGNSSYLLMQINLPSTYGGSDFGPMTKYGAHGCSSLTKVEMSELSMSMDVVKSLSETLREPNWTDGADKFLVNLNEDPIEDFDNVSVTAELLNRLKNDDIYYIGWCGKDNSSKSYDFLQKNDLKGSVISVDSSDTATDSSGKKFYIGNYTAQINAIADCILGRYANSTSTGDIMLLSDVMFNKNIVIKKADSSDTADSEWPDGKWRIDYYNNYKAKDDDSAYVPETTWMSDFQCDFDKCGVYKIYYNYEEGDEPVKVISIHDAPIVTIDAAITTSNSTGTATLTALVDDTNQAAGKSYTYKWSYKNLGTASSPISNPAAVDVGTERTAGISDMTTGAVYIVTLEVTDDLFGYTVITSKQITYIASSQTQKTPPTAFFSLEQSNILMKSGQSAEVVITDSSYDPAGAAITGRTYKLYKVTGGVAEKTGTTITVTNGKYTVPASTVSGEYAIGLVVTSANGTSSEMKRNFNVVNDTTAPTVEFSIGKGTLTLDNSQTTMTFNDEGGSGYKGYKYYVSTSSETPTSGQWSVMSLGNEKTVTFPMMNGSYYVHYQIEDNAGNITTNYEGPFVRDQILNTPDNLAFAEGDSPVLTWNGDDRINDTDKASYTVTIYKNGKVFDEIKGLTDNKYIAANIVRGGDGTYSYTVQTLNSGNADASSDTVKYISGQISDMSPELVYVKPQESGVNGGNLNLDEGATQDKIDEVFQGHATLVSDAPLEIMLNSDINLKETLVISNNIIINLNGHTIKGPDGTKESPDGKPALEVASDNVKIILRGEGKVIGGNGYSDSEGGNGGDGGSGITFGDTEGGSLVTGEDTTVQGGEGGQSTEGVGGDGGSGVEGNDIDATIGGDLLGGDGGDGATKGGDGGSGIETTGDSNIKVKEDAEIGGGNGGDGSTGGNGGSGINSEGGSAEIESGSNIKGGAGGDGSTGDGGAGGNGVETTDSDVDNRGNVSGGDGGSSTGGSGGNGGNAYDTEGGNVNNYDGDTTGGNSGTDTGEGSQKPQDGQTNNSTGKANGGSINIPDISEDASEEEKQAWAENVKNQLDNAFGENNAGYDPENKKIILYNDVQLENPLEPVSDLTIDLNGHTLTGPDGTRENPDGQPAIKMPDGSNLKVENTSDKEGGIYGGNGYSGQKTGQDGNPENGGNGGDAIQFTGAGTADIGEDVNIKGGNGGNSNGADAGDGGCAIKGSDVDTTIKGSAIGGNGGNGGLTGGNGGTAIDAGDGTVDFGEECKLAGGNGGSGDTGGNGGNALDYSNPDADVSIPENADVSGGKGGTSVNGNTAKDGESSDNTFKPAGGVISNPVTQENLDTVFGPGVAEYDEDTNTIKLNKDVELGDTVVLDNDINIDLNGHTLKGTDGTTESPDAKPALKVNGDTEVTITDSSEDGNGQVIGGNGADVSSEDAAGNGAPAVDISGNGTVNIDKDVNIIGGNGGDNTTGPAGNGGSAVNVSPGSSLNADGDITGGDGGYSSKGNGGNGGSAVSGSGADININGNATGGDGGNSNNAEAEAGKGGNVVDGDQTSLNMNGGAIPGNGGTNKKDSDNPGAGGAVSDVTPVTYNVVTELERLNYSGNDTVELNTTFEAQLISVLGNNRYASLPDSIEIKINNVETVVEVIDRAFESEETFEYVVYSKTDGSIYIPAAYVKGSIYIKANLVVVTSCTVSTEEELKDAADAAVGIVTLGDDISITDEISIQNNTTVDAGEYDITVEEGRKLSNAGKITGTGDINNKGTVENTGKLNPTVRNEGIVKNSGNGDVADLIDLGGTVDNTATVNARHIAVWYIANNGTDDIHEELISEGEGYDVWVNTFKNGTRYFVEWNTREDGTGDKYDRKQIVADENVEYIVLYAIWSEEDAGAKIGDTYYKDLKEALEWSEEGDTVELEKDSDVTENITIPDNVTVDTKGNNINIAEDVVLTVDGKLDVTENGTVTNNGVVDISESGSVENESGSIFNNKGNVNNDGTFNNNEGSTLNNESGAEIGGGQPISNGGDINNDGNIKTTVKNTEDGKVDAEVTWTDKDGNEHSGSLKDVLEYLKENPEEASGAKVELNEDVEVTEPLEVPSGVELSVPDDKKLSIGENGKLSVDEGAELSVEEGGSVEVKPEGTLDNNGTVSVEEGGSLDNNGTVNNNEGGKLENSGTLNNNSELNNNGNIVNTSSGVIAGKGDVDNDGIIGNDGDIAVSGTVTGTEKMSGSGSVTVNMDTIVISKDNDTSIESTVNAKVGKGEITIIVESVDKDNNKSDNIIYDVKIGSAYDFIKSAIGTKGLESLKESDNIYLKFTVVKIADKVEKEQETPIKEVVDSNSNADSKMVIGEYVDISYEIKTNNGTWEKLTELNNEIEVTIQIPEDIKGKSTYFIIRNHDGVCDILEDIDDNPDTITFKTDRFSTYAIAYDEPVESVKTGDNNGAAMALYMIMMLMAAGCAVYAGRKKFSR